MKISLLLLSPLAFVPQVANAQEGDPESKRPYIPRYGVNVGVDRLISSRTRDIFGDQTLSFSPGFGPVFSRSGLTIRPDINIFNASRDVGADTNKAFVLSLGPTFRYGLVRPVEVVEVDGAPVRRFRMFAPYVEAGLGLVYADVSARSEGIANKSMTVGGSFAVGTSVGKNTFVEFRLQALPKINSYEFSTVGFQVGVRF